MFRAFALISAMAAILCMAVVQPSVCGDGKDKTQIARNFEVRMKNTSFDQKDITISVGDTVRWVNEDNGKHSVTTDNGSAVSKAEIIVEGGAFGDRVTFDTAGVYNYHCKFHKGMNGSVKVMK